MFVTLQGHAEADDSLEWEYDRNTRLVAPVGSPEGTFSSIVNVVGENGLEQGASLEVTRRMTELAGQTDLAWMNGDLSYARCLSRLRLYCCAIGHRRLGLWGCHVLARIVWARQD